MSGYRALASYYDRLMATDYEALADFLSAVFSKHGTPPHTLLDLACGSGSLTAALRRRGFDMIGADGSAEMLELAAEKCPDCLLLCQDMRALDLYDVVDGAVCTLDSVSHLLKTADIAAMLERLRLFIAPGGLFVFDVNTPYKHRTILADNTFVLEDDDVLCVWQNAVNDKTCTVTMALDFFESQDDGRYERTSELVRERAYSLPTLKALLETAGFALLAVYDGHSFEEPSPASERWTLVARNTRPTADYL